MNDADTYDLHCDVMLPINVHTAGISVEAIQCTPISKTSGSSILRIVDPDGTHSEQLNFNPVKNEHGECEIMVVSKNNYVVIVTNKTCRLASIISESGCFLTSSIPVGPHESEWTVVGMNSAYVHRLISKLKELGYMVDVISTGQMNMEPVLTTKQERYIRMAYLNGYYKVPKSITLESLEDVTGCSKSTLSVILREAERKIVTNYLELNKDASFSTKKSRKY